MKKGREFLALDIGSARIKALACEARRDGTLHISSLFVMPSRGMRRGMVDDVAEVAGAVNQALVEIRKESPNAHKEIFVNIASAYVKSQTSRGIVAVSRADYQIHHDDIMRVEAAAQAMSIPPNRAVVHLINQEYIVDGITGIKDPLGMVGNRLELVSMIVDVFEPAVKSLTKAIETAGGEVGGMIFGPLASGRSVLTRNQKDLGVVVVDIGHETTSMAVYEEGKLVHVAAFPIGGANVTNDVAVGLRVSLEAAEMIKCSLGSAVAKDVPARDMIDLARVDARAKGAVPRRFVAEIIEARYAEIFEFVEAELKRIGKAGRLPAGAVLSGGGAKVAGVIERAREELRLPAQLGIPDVSRFEFAREGMMEKAEDPEFACATGLVGWGREHGEEPVGQASQALGVFRKLIDYFMP